MQTTTVEIDAMGEEISRTQAVPAAPIFIISGGAGASGVQLVRTTLAQFPAADVPVIVVPHVRQVEQLETIVARAAATAGTIVHTLVDAGVRQALVGLAQAQQVPAIDLFCSSLGRLIWRHLYEICVRDQLPTEFARLLFPDSLDSASAEF